MNKYLKRRYWTERKNVIANISTWSVAIKFLTKSGEIYLSIGCEIKYDNEVAI